VTDFNLGQKARTGDTEPVKARLTVQAVLSLLESEHGPVHYRPRNYPIPELVATVLSQHTSDKNSARAFRGLKETFGTWEAVAKGDVELIARSIEVGGLSRVKAPRIRAMLAQILSERGSLDLEFLKEMYYIT